MIYLRRSERDNSGESSLAVLDGMSLEVASYKISEMVLIDAIYTNHSGSMRLLEYFVRYSKKNGLLDRYFFLFDRRLKSEIIADIEPGKYVVLDPTESARKKRYRNLPSEIKSVFCFGSVPPPIKVKGRPIIILQHNPFFFESPGFALHVKLLYLIKRLYIRLRCDGNYQWIVQTPRMKDILQRVLKINGKKIAVKPFFELDQVGLVGSRRDTQSLSFLYPADGVPQKNHKFLFKVWEYLSEKYGVLPELHLTIPSKFPHLLRDIETLQKKGLRIINHGFISHSAMKQLYLKHKYLLFPSLSESFGLPLIEGGHAGLQVIGSDLPFIYQVVKPSAVFDPQDLDSLSDIIMSLYREIRLPSTEVLVKDSISDIVKIIESPNLFPENV